MPYLVKCITVDSGLENFKEIHDTFAEALNGALEGVTSFEVLDGYTDTGFYTNTPDGTRYEYTIIQIKPFGLEIFENGEQIGDIAYFETEAEVLREIIRFVANGKDEVITSESARMIRSRSPHGIFRYEITEYK